METVSKDVFCQNIKIECNLNNGTDETLKHFDKIYKACNFPSNKKHFTQLDTEFFLLAKQYIDTEHTVEDTAQKIQEKRAEIAEIEQQKKMKSRSNKGNENSIDTSQLSTETGSLDDSTIELAASMGIKQAEIFSEVVQEVTMRRLNEMVRTGEMNRGIRQIWQESMKQLGKPEVLQQKIDTFWQNRQAQIYSSTTVQIAGNEDEEETETVEVETTQETNSQPQSNSPI